ncbi:hypothetical protein CPA40_00655 [Bifidobacterium callitrichos]|uniref:Uncharacterized protein n=1 Tax=Bifidobacterium callitrichos TaxID=762209 RepID=A0A2T3GD97_9BIFI|nr:hypothetical protein CPA40_00655 [Bifidobacterium callitrichos]
MNEAEASGSPGFFTAPTAQVPSVWWMCGQTGSRITRLQRSISRLTFSSMILLLMLVVLFAETKAI